MGNGRIERDVLVVGGGHNGLVCATYLAKAGLKVTVLERRQVVGGAATPLLRTRSPCCSPKSSQNWTCMRMG